LVFIFSIIIVFPYLPGSLSEAFKIGDRVKIADTVRDVLEKIF